MNALKIIAVIGCDFHTSGDRLFSVQLLDFQGRMLPAPQSQLAPPVVVASILPKNWDCSANESKATMADNLAKTALGYDRDT